MTISTRHSCVQKDYSRRASSRTCRPGPQTIFAFLDYLHGGGMDSHATNTTHTSSKASPSLHPHVDGLAHQLPALASQDYSSMTVTRVTLPLLALATLCINYATAFWRMPCGIVQMGRIDPVVFPGTISAHVHKISGGSSMLLTRPYSNCCMLTTHRYRHKLNPRLHAPISMHIVRRTSRSIWLLDASALLSAQ